MGLNCTGMLVSRYLSIVNTTALHGQWLVESIDVGKVGPIVSYTQINPKAVHFTSGTDTLMTVLPISPFHPL